MKADVAENLWPGWYGVRQRHTRLSGLLVDTEKCKELKMTAKGSFSFVSTNDLIMSGLMELEKQPVGCMLVDLRPRIADADAASWGFLHLMSYYFSTEKLAGDPTASRSLQHGENLLDEVPSGDFFSVVTNWASAGSFIEGKGLAVEAHCPGWIIHGCDVVCRLDEDSTKVWCCFDQETLQKLPTTKPLSKVVVHGDDPP